MRPVPGSSGSSLAERDQDSCRWQESACGSVSTSSADARRKGVIGVGTPDVSQSFASSPSSSAVFQVGMLSHFWINEEA